MTIKIKDEELPQNKLFQLWKKQPELFALWKKDKRACSKFKKIGYRPPKRMPDGIIAFCDFLGRKKTLTTNGFAETIQQIEKCMASMNENIDTFIDEDNDVIENLEKEMLWDIILHFLDVSGFFSLKTDMDMFWFKGQLFDGLPLVPNPNKPEEWGIPITSEGETPIDVRGEVFGVARSLVDYMYSLLKKGVH